MATILVSYKHHTEPRLGGSVHGYHVVEQLVRLGHRLITAERATDDRLERLPRTPPGLHRALAVADLVYMRCDVRPWDQALLRLNRLTRRRPVVLEVNAVAEEALSFSDGPLDRARVAAFRTLYHRTAAHAAAVLCVSENLARHVRDTYPVDPTRVVVVPNGGTPADAPPSPRGAGTLRAVWAGGSRWPWQAIETVLEAADRLHADRPGAEIHIYTEGDPARFAGHPAVRHHAPVPHADLPARLASMDVALCLYRPMPYSPAGFYNSPLKLFDYLAAGLPVVASPLGQIAEVVEDGVNGLLVEDDAEAVASALLRLANAPDERRRMGDAALATLRDGYTWDHTGERIQAAIERVR